MREFILRAKKARTDHKFDITNLRAAGHMEIVCDCISSALWFSNHIRDNTKLHVIFEGGPRPPLLLSFDGATLQGMGYDEASVAFKIQQIFEKAKTIPNEPTQVSLGITLQKKSFESLVREFCESKRNVYFLAEKGVDLRESDVNDDSVFIFGDNAGMPDKSEGLLERLGAKQLSLGPTTVFAAHCAIIVHNELDRRYYK